jgi:hypothetical protein
MNRTVALYSEHIISVVKYLLAALVIFAGVSTAWMPLTPVSGPLGFIYSTRVGLLLFGAVVFASGALLMVSKIKHSRRGVGRGLMACYCCFLFATIIQIAAFGLSPANWAGNAIFALLTGALWLRWKFKTEYIDPGHFRHDVIEMKYHK